MKVLVLGGDGYLGWATAMYLSAHGHQVLVVDNYLRRNMSRSLERDPLIEVPNMHRRSDIWNSVSGQTIKVGVGDVADYQFLSRLFENFQPSAIIHYAEIPSAPYSMMGRDQAAQTLNNNLTTTLNVVFAIRDFCPSCHLIKLGTMGEYGTPNIDIEEGYLEVEHKGRSDRFLFPKTPGSIYHLTKVQDSDLLYFACRTWNLGVTDLNQGPVYGVQTPEMQEDTRLSPQFAYDDIFGTVLNRFVVQAVVGFPLTVYGKGGQTRGYLNIADTMQCVELALNQPAENGEFRVLNQFTETFTVNDLAEKVVAAASVSGLDARIEHVQNPRRESEDHYYKPMNTGLMDLGLEPHYLTERVLVGMIEFVRRHENQVRRDIISPRVVWKA